METIRTYYVMLGLSAALCAAVLPVYAQQTSAFNELEFLTHQTGLGVRSLGMGGTGIATARDFSAVMWNPAGLAYSRLSAVNLGMSTSRANTDADFLGNPSSSKQNFTRFHSLGGVFPVPVYQGSMTFAAGFGRVHDFNSVLFYEGFNNDPADNVYQQEDVTEEGALNTLALAGAVEVAPQVSVGLAMNFWFGDHQYTSIFEEFDDDNNWTFDNSYSNQYIDSDIYGFDAKIGVQYRANPYFNFGATIGFPRTLWVEENYQDDYQLYYDADQGLEPETDYSEGFFKYRIRLPFTFGLGAAFNIERLILTGDLEYIDWSQTRYLTDTPITGLSRSAANRDISRTINGSLMRRIGAEYVVLPGSLALRAGYGETPSPYEGSTRDDLRKVFSLGFGLPLGNTARVDLAYQHGWWQQTSIGAATSAVVTEDRTDDKVHFDLSFNF